MSYGQKRFHYFENHDVLMRKTLTLEFIAMLFFLWQEKIPFTLCFVHIAAYIFSYPLSLALQDDTDYKVERPAITWQWWQERTC